jgi:hypothetical protein
MRIIDEILDPTASTNTAGLLSPQDRLMSLFQGLTQAGMHMAQPGLGRGQALAMGLGGFGQGVAQGNQQALQQRLFLEKLMEQKQLKDARAKYLEANPHLAGIASAAPDQFFKSAVENAIPKAPTPHKIGETRKFTQGDKEITQEWTGQGWQNLGEAGRWEQAWRDPAYIKAQSDIRAAGKPSVSVQVQTNAQNELYKGMTGDFVKEIGEHRKRADSALSQLQTVDTARDLLDRGVITGTGANFRLGLHRALSTAGLVNGDKVENTEAFMATMGRQTLDLVKGLGAGSGISNADREYAEKIAGGNIDMSEAGIRRLLDINDRASRASIDSYNTRVQPLLTDENVPSFMRGNLTIAPPPVRERKPPPEATPEPAPAPQGAAPREGQTAINPKTGERREYRGGKWVPIK